MCTANRAGDEERGRKEGKYQAGGQRDGVDGRVQHGVTAVISMQNINLLNPLSRGQQLYEKSRACLVPVNQLDMISLQCVPSLLHAGRQRKVEHCSTSDTT